MSTQNQWQLLRLQASDKVLSTTSLKLEGPGIGAPAGWFIGPKAENKHLLIELIVEAINQHCSYRLDYHPEDPEVITEEEKRHPAYEAAVAKLRKESTTLFKELRRSAPIFSMRHQGHMLWDQALPAIIGYFAAMLYNQNNVAAEASPITTWLELEVGNDLCRMLGYDVPAREPVPPAPIPQPCAPPDKIEPAPPPEKIVPWGHITCDGSVANIEALWAARNVKFFAVALRAALREVPALAAARDLTVRLLDGSTAKLVDLDTWVLLNLKIDDVVALPHRIHWDKGIEVSTTMQALRPYTVQEIGIVDFYRRFMATVPRTPVAVVPSTRHYSWPKAATMLGLGQNNVLKVHVDLQARMDINHLVETLRDCLLQRVPVIAVVAVIGSTEESAVDPLREILDVRERFRKQGMDFAVHCDAAWGGYLSSMYRDDEGFRLLATIPELPMSDYVRTQYDALKDADSITVDPHKAGYVPYPAGGLCYRNSALRDQISLKSPVIFHSQTEPTVGIYGIEGSKPGAAAAAVYLAHRVIRPTRTGYGKILGQCMWTSKRMYCRLLTMAERDPPDKMARYKISFLQMLPAERSNNGTVEKEMDRVRSFVPLSNDKLKELLAMDPAAKDLFMQVGSDQLILSYSFNFFSERHKAWNTDVELCNKLNNTIYEICSITRRDDDPLTKNLILTGSDFDVESYGKPFVDHYCRRLGIRNPDDKNVSFLISTTMNPWTTETAKGDFLDDIEMALRDAVYQAIEKVDC
jgi:glutamate/tyrosine decarboxylase-like PLP-dependent enzyme